MKFDIGNIILCILALVAGAFVLLPIVYVAGRLLGYGIGRSLFECFARPSITKTREEEKEDGKHE